MVTPRKDPEGPRRRADTRSHRFRRVLTEEWLRSRWARGDSLVEMAQEADCSVATIRNYAARLALPSRPNRRPQFGWDEVLTPEYLHATYIEDRMTVEAIAAELGTSSSTVVRWLTAYGIPRRGHQPGVDNLLYEDELTADFLAQRLAERASMVDIAKEVGCAITAVRLAVARAGLDDNLAGVRPARPPSAPPDELRRLYDSGLPLEAIAARLGVSRTKVRADLSRFGIRPYARPGFRQTDGAWAPGTQGSGSRSDKAPWRQGASLARRSVPTSEPIESASPMGTAVLTADVVKVLLVLARGSVTDSSGRAVERLRQACGLPSREAVSAVLVQLEGHGLVTRNRNASRTYAVAITDAGHHWLVTFGRPRQER